MESPFAHNLRAALAAREMTQEKLAREINASNRSVAGWCLGETLPRWDKLALIAKALEHEPGWFYNHHPEINYDLPVAAA